MCKQVGATCYRCQQSRQLTKANAYSPIIMSERHYGQPTAHWHLDHWGHVRTNSEYQYIWKVTYDFTDNQLWAYPVNILQCHRTISSIKK